MYEITKSVDHVSDWYEGRVPSLLVVIMHPGRVHNNYEKRRYRGSTAIGKVWM